MKYILITLICMFSLQLSAQKGSFYLTNVDIAPKDMITYHYKNSKDIYVATFKTVKKETTLEITKNKTHYFTIKKDEKGRPVYRLGKSEKMIGFNKKSYEILPQELKFFLAYLEADEQEFHPQFNGRGGDNGKFNDGIPNALGPEMSAAGDGGDNNCTQTATCGCSNGKSVSVTCGCGNVISCEVRTAEVCDTDANGYRVNCRIVQSCSGRCDPGTK